MAAEATWVRYGEEALGALSARIDTALEARPLGPVTVVTPSPSVAVATRRALARHRGGLVGVSFHSMGALAEQLAAPRLGADGIGIGVDREVVVAGVRAALDTEPGRLGPIRHHRSTWEAVAATIADLDSVDADGGSTVDIAASGELPAEMRRLHRAVTELVGPLGGTEILRLASAAVSDGTARLDDVGPVIVYLPGRLSTPEVALLATLADRLDVELLLGTAGRSAEDRRVADGFARLGVQPPAEPVERPSATAIVSANDIDDEVRAVVRRLLRAADHGVPLDRMALVHPRGAPYTRVVADVLRSTGMPFSAPSAETLAQRAVGRVLTAFLGVIRSDFARHDVVDLWATGIVVDADGRLVPSARFDDESRRLGVIRGAARWHAALDASDERIRARLPEDEETDEGLQQWVDDHLATNARLRAALGTLETLAAAVPTRWSDVGDWCDAVIDGLCGPTDARPSWPEYEIVADEAIRTALGRLVALDRVEPSPTRAVLFDTIESVLDAPAPRRTRTGTGLLVTTIDRPPVVPLDTVAVVGLVEGQVPAIGRDDVLLGDALRAELGLPGTDDRRLAERRAFDATIASASTTRLLSFARNDQRSGRTMVPSRWLLDAIEESTGARPDVEALMAGRPVDGVDCVDSYSAGLASVAADEVAALHTDEWAFSSMASAGTPDGHPLLADEVVAAGTVAIRARRSGSFTRFDGNLDGDGVPVSDLPVLSPTSLETYAACPRRWFFSHALRLRSVDRPEEIDRLQARDKGTLAHLVLERFFGEMLDAGTVPPPGASWPLSAIERLDLIAAEEFRALEERGLTGHPRWWEHDRSEIVVALHRALQQDVDVRARFSTMPIAVEFRFGRGDAPPLQVDLGDGRTIALAGSADRVDLGDGVLEIWDYKYTGSRSYHDLVKDEESGGDPLQGGTRLQLVAYGMAAAAAHEVPEVHAAYWFLRPDTEKTRIGYPVDDAIRDRFRRVLGVLADGIGEGRFPARPGEYLWHRGTHAHCSYCDFDDICPRDRDEEWERVRFHPSLHRLGRLVDEGSASVLDDEVAP